MAKTGIQVTGFEDCPAFQSLSPQHQIFVAEYVKLSINGEKAPVNKAARRAKVGGKAPSQVGSRLLKKAKVAAAVNELKRKLVLPTIATAQEVLEFFTNVKRGNITRVCSWNGGNGLIFNKDSDEMDPADTQLIKKIKVKEYRSANGDYTEVKTDVELYSAMEAAELLGKHHGIFKDPIAESITSLGDRLNRAIARKTSK